MAQLFDPHFQAIDAAGVPISGANLYFYVAGTTTLITVYQDSAGTTPHTNPVIADASGLFAPIFVNPGSIKVVLKTGSGVTIQTIDNINSGNTSQTTANTVEEAEDLTPAGIPDAIVTYGYYAPGDGGGGVYTPEINEPATQPKFYNPAVNRWFTGAESEMNLARFGSKHDGAGTGNSTVNNTALSDALAWMNSVDAAGRQGTLYIPPGILDYDNMPNFAANYRTILGQGECRLKNHGNGNHMFLDGGALTGGFRQMKVKNLIFDPTPDNLDGFYVRAIHDSEFDINVRGCGDTYSAFRVDFAVCSDFRFVCSVNEGSWAADTKPAVGIKVDRRSTGFEYTSWCRFSRPVIEGPAIGILVDHAQGNQFVGGTSEGCTDMGMYLTANSLYNKIHDMDFESNTNRDILMLGTENVVTDCDTLKEVFVGGGNHNKIVRGSHAGIVIDTPCNDTLLEDAVYRRVGTGTLSNGGTRTRGRAFNMTSKVWTDFDRLEGAITFDPAVLADGAGINYTLTVTGAVLGDMAISSFSSNFQGMISSTEVSAPNTVSVRVQNESGGAIDLPSGTLKAWVLR